jgi:hypothetical protein
MANLIKRNMSMVIFFILCLVGDAYRRRNLYGINVERCLRTMVVDMRLVIRWYAWWSFWASALSRVSTCEMAPSRSWLWCSKTRWRIAKIWRHSSRRRPEILFLRLSINSSFWPRVWTKTLQFVEKGFRNTAGITTISRIALSSQRHYYLSKTKIEPKIEPQPHHKHRSIHFLSVTLAKVVSWFKGY